MAEVIINQSVLLVRDGKRITPTIGKSFDLTDDEVRDINSINPRAISALKTVEKDPKSVPLEQKPTADELMALTKADLVAMAKGAGLTFPDNATKLQLVELLNADDEL